MPWWREIQLRNTVGRYSSEIQLRKEVAGGGGGGQPPADSSVMNHNE